MKPQNYRVQIYVDSGFLIKITADNNNLILDYVAMLESVAKSVNMGNYDAVYWYTGASEYESFFNRHIKPKIKNNFFFRAGRFQNTENNIKEKGVDILIAIDIVKNMILNKPDWIIFISSDSDFEPLLQFVKDSEVKIKLITWDKQRAPILEALADHIYIIDNKNIYNWEKEQC